MSREMLPSELYALHQGYECKGPEECYWCGAPCERKWGHGCPPPVPFVRSNGLARKPGNSYICVGCWLFRRGKMSTMFNDGVMRDGFRPQNTSWYMTDDECVGILPGVPTSKNNLYDRLLNPPLLFSLSLLDKTTEVILQRQVINHLTEIKATTLLSFTLDNVKMDYSVYELEEGLHYGTEGKMPGVRALIELLGTYTNLIPRETEGDGRGRPGKDEETNLKRMRRIVRGPGETKRRARNSNEQDAK